MTTIITRIMVLLLLCVPVAVAQQGGDEEELMTGTELLENCQPEAGEPAPTTFCKEFVFGLVQTLAGLQEMMPEAEKIFCIDPEAIGLETVTEAVTDWLETNPQHLEEPAFLLTSEALRDNYPCDETANT